MTPICDDTMKMLVAAVCLVFDHYSPSAKSRFSKLLHGAEPQLVLPLDNQRTEISRLLIMSHDLLIRRLRAVPQHIRSPVLRDDDVVEVTGHLEATLFAVRPVSYTEAFLHPWLPCPGVDRMPRPAVALLARRRRGGRGVDFLRLLRSVDRRGSNVIVGAAMAMAMVMFILVLLLGLELHFIGLRRYRYRLGEPSGQLIRESAIQHNTGRADVAAANRRTKAVVRFAYG